MAAWVPAAHADVYPSQPVKILDGYTPGGSTDTIARYVAARLNAERKMTVIVENRPGAAGQIAMGAIAKSKPDGYTLMVVPNELLSVAPSLYKQLPYDMARDITPVAALADVPLVLTAASRLKAGSVQELLAYARQNPGKLNYGSAGPGTIHHLSGELFKSLARVDMVHVPYRGTSAAVSDLLSGQIDFVFSPITAVLPHIKAGKLRALAVAGNRRINALPDTPTVAEAGVPGYESSLWVLLVAPSATPDAIVDQWAAMARDVVSKDEARAQFAPQGVELISLSRAEIRRKLEEDTQRWQKVIAEAGITVE